MWSRYRSMLSSIGESLEERFAMEDKLITMLHDSYGRELSQSATG